jgi:hypothetical protein
MIQADNIVKILIKLGGTSVKPVQDAAFNQFIENCQLLNFPINDMPGLTQSCHINVTALFTSGKIHGIGTGYALHNNVWYRHSWGINGKNIIETTGKFQKYWGQILIPENCEKFVQFVSTRSQATQQPPA